MSAASSIAPNLPTTPGPEVQTSATNPFAEISSEEFLGIILEELSNQDPFEPNDTAATLEQLSSLRNIEGDIALQEQLQSLVLQNTIGQAGALIGRQVEGLNNDGRNVSGTVTSVRVIDGQSRLQLDDGSAVEFANVTNVAAAPPPPANPLPEVPVGLTPTTPTPAAANRPVSANPVAASSAVNPAAALAPAVDPDTPEPPATP
ncbi:MAG: flagellar hook capping FlgD N-terminal domain-containing protein [Planctomycetota bacterium]